MLKSWDRHIPGFSTEEIIPFSRKKFRRIGKNFQPEMFPGRCRPPEPFPVFSRVDGWKFDLRERFAFGKEYYGSHLHYRE
ncbi:MAG: hypothetical protein O2807_11120 [bacterium]|nr:hypothetical protein [bacterium]